MDPVQLLHQEMKALELLLRSLQERLDSLQTDSNASSIPGHYICPNCSLTVNEKQWSFFQEMCFRCCEDMQLPLYKNNEEGSSFVTCPKCGKLKISSGKLQVLEVKDETSTN